MVSLVLIVASQCDRKLLPAGSDVVQSVTMKSGREMKSVSCFLFLVEKTSTFTGTDVHTYELVENESAVMSFFVFR